MTEVVTEQQGPKLPVLVLDVILHCSLARTAQLVGLFHVVLVDLNLFVIFTLFRKGEGGSGAEKRTKDMEI